MSFGGLLVHSVTIVRPVPAGTEDEYGQPEWGTPSETTAAAMVQPKSAREADDSRSAGVVVGDHTIYLELMALDEGDAIIYAGDRYDIVAIRRIAFGSFPHLEVEARRIGTA